MANHTISISNSINCFGPAPSTKWGTNVPYTMNWGVSKWGEGTEDLQVAISKFIGNSLALDGATIDLSSGFNSVISNSILLESETTSEGLADGSGYSYVFTKPTTDAEEQDSSVFTEESSPSTAWTEDSQPSTSWS